MIQEEHNLLMENNIILKQILIYLRNKDSPNNDLKDFTMNVINNLISNNIDKLKIMLKSYYTLVYIYNNIYICKQF